MDYPRAMPVEDELSEKARLGWECTPFYRPGRWLSA